MGVPNAATNAKMNEENLNGKAETRKKEEIGWVVFLVWLTTSLPFLALPVVLSFLLDPYHWDYLIQVSWLVWPCILFYVALGIWGGRMVRKRGRPKEATAIWLGTGFGFVASFPACFTVL